MKKVLLCDVKFAHEQQPVTVVFNNYTDLHTWLSASADEILGFACRIINVLENDTQETSEN